MTDLTFEWQIDEFLIYCHSKQLRPKTTQSYEQALRLFARWCEEERHIEAVDKVKEADIRLYINDIQERGKYTFYVKDSQKQKTALTVGGISASRSVRSLHTAK